MNHKTVFVLDHTPYFGIPCGAPLDLDLKSNKAPASIIQKSLWTLSVESTVEYCRIVYDIFPTGKLIRFIVSDTAAHIVNTWNVNTQSLNHILNAMSMIGVPLPLASAHNPEFTVLHGLRAAIEALAEPTEQQTNLLNSGSATDQSLQNQGRIVCITSARDDASMKTLEDIFHSVLVQQNSQIGKAKNMLHVSKCQLMIINMLPSNLTEKFITDRPKTEVSPLLTTQVLSVRASTLHDYLTHLILDDYDLASTTVTGIPMKEEQKASSSANYDVEIFHSRSAHSVILGRELVLPKSIKEGTEYETVTLKWCTPRDNSAEMQNCIAQNRVTCSDVTSRPSSCLINFLLAGRSVLLEMPRKSGGKLTSHLLSAHGGEIFIHTLSVSRSCLDELPSISEGVGGRNVNYRIHEFGAFMQQFKLVPKRLGPDTQFDENLSRLRREFEKCTIYFPLTLGSTIVFNIRQFLDIFLSNLNKPELSEEETVQCKQVIYQLVALEARQEPLPTPSVVQKLTPKKKEEQYRLLWTELEILSSAAGKTSILNCIRECRSRGAADGAGDKSDSVAKDSERGAEKKTLYRAASTDSPMSPTMDIGISAGLLTKKPKLFNENRSLFDMVTTSERAQNQKRLDFSGRLNTPPNQIAKLYPNPVKPVAVSGADGKTETEVK